MTKYELPELDYAYDALESYISGEIMELHHSKYHANYVNGVNAAPEKFAAARESDDFAAATGLPKDLAFNLGGHTNHSLFWKLLSLSGDGQSTGELAEVIERDFGSFEKFQVHFSAAALGLQGPGWVILGYGTIAEHLVIEQMTDQQGNPSINPKPVLLLGIWEHAFHLQCKNVKADYIKAVWNIFNWDYVVELFAAAK